MSEAKGPYSVEQGGGGFYVCGTFPRRLFFRSEDEATSVLNALNLARSNALAAQAERVKEACDAWGAMCLAKSTKIDDTKWVERWTFDEPLVDRMGNAVEALKNALTPPAKGGSDANH